MTKLLVVLRLLVESTNATCQLINPTKQSLDKPMYSGRHLHSSPCGIPLESEIHAVLANSRRRAKINTGKQAVIDYMEIPDAEEVSGS